MEKRNYLTYCGLYCELCDARNKTPGKARELRQSLKDGEFEEWGPGIKEYDDFWKLLNRFSDTPVEMCCKNETCGHPNCRIRKCAKARGVETCAFCEDYPCEMILRFYESEPLLLHDGQRMKKIGIDKWIEEQEQRKEKGFNYSDIRTGKPDIPIK
ncbi:MAG: DUF3795 domain-containing protein [Clostridia bacterium]|nr:DUF3795 domain-containing protein [Clostridia bacterium]